MESAKRDRAMDFGAGTLAQDYLAAIVESSDDAIIAKNLNGIIQACNASAERLFGYQPGELIGQSVRVLIPPDREREEDEILGRIRQGHRVDHFETVRLTKDGRPIDISLTVSPVRDASGAIIGVSKTARDITERKQAAAALAAQEEWFRVTLGSIGDGIIASDPDGHVTYMNGVAETLTGWTNDAAEGTPLVDVFHIVNETTRQPVENPAGLVIRSGHVVGLANHTVLISRDGGSVPSRTARHRSATTTDASSGSCSSFVTSRSSGGPKRRSPSSANGSRRRLKALEMRSSPPTCAAGSCS
jgi:PAS domain S-box-containing protein